MRPSSSCCRYLLVLTGALSTACPGDDTAEDGSSGTDSMLTSTGSTSSTSGSSTMTSSTGASSTGTTTASTSGTTGTSSGESGSETVADTDEESSSGSPNECEGVANGTPCEDDGLCFEGECVDSICGDGVISGAEECDDGNTTPLDGCSAACLLTEECEACLDQNCNPYPGQPEDSGFDFLDICRSSDEEFLTGPGSGRTWADLCLGVLECAETSGCAFSFSTTTCACEGFGYDQSLPECIEPGYLAGPCGAEFAAAAGTTDPATVITLQVDFTVPLGVFTNLWTCARDNCPEECWDPPRCGNGTLDGATWEGEAGGFAGEQCDDGNTAAGDGCSPGCMLECGDGVRTGTEECDDGNEDASDGCTPECMLSSECGNSTVEYGEACDDGNTDPGDGCSPSCVLECGNGVEDAGEECDDGNIVNNDGCSSECVVEFCGDGVVNNGEACDDGGTAEGDGCSAICERECLPDAVACCGNGEVEDGEACDDGNDVVGDGCEEDCTESAPRDLCLACVATNCRAYFEMFDAVTGCLLDDPTYNPDTGCEGVTPCLDDPECNAVLECAERTGCYEEEVPGAFPNRCSCGTQTDLSACQANPFNSPNGGNGPCIPQYVAVYESEDPAYISSVFIDPTTAGGRANLELACRNQYCAELCTIDSE